MIYQNLEFHNVDVLEDKKSVLGLALQRFPEAVRLQLKYHSHERGRFYSQVSTCCEIRFVTDAMFFRLSLSSLEADTRVFIFKGNFLHSVHTIPMGIVTTLHIEVPEGMETVVPDALQGHPFSTDVWRVLFDKQSCGIFCGIDTFGHEVRPPKEEEKPGLKWLAYGSSITFGGNTNLITNAYVMQAARRLGADVFNKAIAGSCFCDECVADYLSAFEHWDFATLELGINMLGRFTPEEFERRALSLVKKLLRSNPGKPIILITPYRCRAQFCTNQENKSSQNFYAFSRILKSIHADLKSENLYILDGTEILNDFSGLSTDLVHPSDDGHVLMGTNLAREIRKVLESRNVIL